MHEPPLPQRGTEVEVPPSREQRYPVVAVFGALTIIYVSIQYYWHTKYTVRQHN